MLNGCNYDRPQGWTLCEADRYAEISPLSAHQEVLLDPLHT
jgi:hypothetical protein